MNIILVTPNEPFYMSENLSFFLENIPEDVKLKGCILLRPTPYGRRASFVGKAKKTYKVFGLKFFLFYSLEYVKSKILKKDVKKILEDHDIPIIQLPFNINHTDSIKTISQYNPDLIVSILGNQIFKKPILDLPRKGCINLHTSLLPKYRGMMPTFWSLLNDEKEIGVSVFLMDEGIDTGPVISQAITPIKSTDSQKTLIQRTKKIGMQLIIDAIELIKEDKVQFISNENLESSYYSYPKSEDVKLFLKKGKKFF
jgi:methionyl-tRNA formyltransferase